MSFAKRLKCITAIGLVSSFVAVGGAAYFDEKAENATSPADEKAYTAKTAAMNGAALLLGAFGMVNALFLGVAVRKEDEEKEMDRNSKKPPSSTDLLDPVNPAFYPE